MASLSNETVAEIAACHGFELADRDVADSVRQAEREGADSDEAANLLDGYLQEIARFSHCEARTAAQFHRDAYGS